jgi:hypothetical protein
MSSRLPFVFVTAIGLRMLRKNGRVLIAYAAELPSKDVSGICSLPFSQWLIDKLTAATSAGFADARILDGHLFRIRRQGTVYISSRAFIGTRAFTDVRFVDPARIDCPSTQPHDAVNTMITRIVTVGIRAAWRLTDTLNRLRIKNG